MSADAASSSGLLQCSICLDDLKKPVSIPCGHIHCTKCLTSHVASSSNAFEIPCPTCRTPFAVVNPNLAYVPEKYHGFVTPSIRRIYLPHAPPTNTSAQLEDLQTRLARAESTITALRRDKAQLMDRAESAQAAARAHAEGERTANADAARWKRKYESTKAKYADAKGQLCVLWLLRATESATDHEGDRRATGTTPDTSSASASSATLAEPPRASTPRGLKRTHARPPPAVGSSPDYMDPFDDSPALRIPKRPRLAGTAGSSPDHVDLIGDSPTRPHRASTAPDAPPFIRPRIAPPRPLRVWPPRVAAAAADPPPVFLFSSPSPGAESSAAPRRARETREGDEERPRAAAGESGAPRRRVMVRRRGA